MEVCSVDWLPEPEVIMARSKAAAAADVLLSPDPELRQYWFKKEWQPGIAMAKRHDGAGSFSTVLQSGDCTVVKVTVDRRSIGPDALARFQSKPDPALPPLAVQVIKEEEFRYQELSFLAWKVGDSPWQGLHFRVDSITSEVMGKQVLELICQGPKIFYLFAKAYHEVTVDPQALKDLFKLTPLNEEMAQKIAPDSDLDEAKDELNAIGYPLA